jgi:hypothetical protein
LKHPEGFEPSTSAWKADVLAVDTMDAGLLIFTFPAKGAKIIFEYGTTPASVTASVRGNPALVLRRINLGCHASLKCNTTLTTNLTVAAVLSEPLIDIAVLAALPLGGRSSNSEIIGHVLRIVDLEGFEPSSSCLQGRRSTN